MPPEVQAFLEGLSVWTVVAWVVGIGAIIGFIAKHVWPLLRGLSNFLDDVKGEEARDGVPARPGIMARLASIESSLSSVEEKQTEQGGVLEVVRHEMFPNSGKSMRDQTNRMEEKLDRDNARIAELSDLIGALEEKVGGVDEKVTVLDERLDEHITQSTAIIQSLKENHEERP